MTKRTTAAQARDNIPASDETAPLAGQPPAADPVAETPVAPQCQPGDDDSQTSWVKKASVIVDPEAGIKFHFDYDKHKAIITFDEKPTQELLAGARPILSEGGFEWDKVNKDGWKKKIQFNQREDDRRETKKPSTPWPMRSASRKDCRHAPLAKRSPSESTGRSSCG